MDAVMEPLYGIDGNCQVRVRGQMSLSYPSRDSHLRKESASKEMQEQERIARKLPRSGLVQPLLIRPFCSDNMILVRFSASFAQYPLPALAGRHDDRDL